MLYDIRVAFCGGEQRKILSIYPTKSNAWVFMPFTGELKTNEHIMLFKNGDQNYYIDKYYYCINRWSNVEEAELFGLGVIHDDDVWVPSLFGYSYKYTKTTDDYMEVLSIPKVILYKDGGYRYHGNQTMCYPQLDIFARYAKQRITCNFLIPEFVDEYHKTESDVITAAMEELRKKIPRYLAEKIISYLKITDFYQSYQRYRVFDHM